MIIYFVRHASAGEPLSNPKKDEKRRSTRTASSNADLWAAPWPR